MKKISKKTFSILIFLSSVFVTSIFGSFAAIFIKKQNEVPDIPDKKPLDRDDRYELFKLKFDVKNNLNNLIDTRIKNNLYEKFISEKLVQKNLKADIIDVLKKEPRFSHSVDRYNFEINYFITENEKKLYVDVVWYVNKTSNEFFYDQFLLCFDSFDKNLNILL